MPFVVKIGWLYFRLHCNFFYSKFEYCTFATEGLYFRLQTSTNHVTFVYIRFEHCTFAYYRTVLSSTSDLTTVISSTSEVFTAILFTEEDFHLLLLEKEAL